MVSVGLGVERRRSCKGVPIDRDLLFRAVLAPGTDFPSRVASPIERPNVGSLAIDGAGACGPAREPSRNRFPKRTLVVSRVLFDEHRAIPGIARERSRGDSGIGLPFGVGSNPTWDV